MRIAIDVMGGDHAPDAMIDGAVASLPLLGDNDALVLVGDRKVIEESLTEHGVAGEPRLQI
ncbi:MAG: hypothetical protein WD079_03205, partial [Phycisphaeraceae bacterium]